MKKKGGISNHHLGRQEILSFGHTVICKSRAIINERQFASVANIVVAVGKVWSPCLFTKRENVVEEVEESIIPLRCGVPRYLSSWAGKDVVRSQESHQEVVVVSERVERICSQDFYRIFRSKNVKKKSHEYLYRNCVEGLLDEDEALIGHSSQNEGNRMKEPLVKSVHVLVRHLHCGNDWCPRKEDAEWSKH